jgi:hypothetical protein
MEQKQQKQKIMHESSSSRACNARQWIALSSTDITGLEACERRLCTWGHHTQHNPTIFCVHAPRHGGMMPAGAWQHADSTIVT